MHDIRTSEYKQRTEGFEMGLDAVGAKKGENCSSLVRDCSLSLTQVISSPSLTPTKFHARLCYKCSSTAKATHGRCVPHRGRIISRLSSFKMGCVQHAFIAHLSETDERTSGGTTPQLSSMILRIGQSQPIAMTNRIALKMADGTARFALATLTSF